MCNFVKLALNTSNILKGLKSLLLFLPSFLLIFTFLLSFDYEPVRTVNRSNYEEQVLSNDNDICCYNANSVHLGEANTIEGYRIESNFSENNSKTVESTFKCLAHRDIYFTQSRIFSYINFIIPQKDAALSNKTVLFHQLLI